MFPLSDTILPLAIKVKKTNKSTNVQPHILLCLFFVVCTFFLSSQTLSEQVQTWKKEGNQKISVDSVDLVMDWIEMSLRTQVKLSWSYEEDVHLLPQNAIEYSEKLFPEILVFGLAALAAEDQYSLLQLANIKNLGSELYTAAIDNSTMQEYRTSTNIFSSTLIYSTNILPLFYELFLPIYSSLEIPKTLNIAHKTSESYSSIIFATDTAIPYISNTDQLLEYTPKLFPKVYGNENQVVFSPEYYQSSQNKAINTGRSFSYFNINQIQKIVLGQNPYVVIPLYINSDMQGDIVISSFDTQSILSNPQIRSLLQEGKVFFALSKKQYTILNASNSTVDEN